MTNFLTTAQTLDRLQKRLGELGAWRDAERRPLPAGQFFAHGAVDGQPIAVGDAWPSRDFPVRMRFRAEIPAAWAGQPTLLRFDVGGEALLSVNGHSVGGLNPYHREYRLPFEVGGGPLLDIEIRASPKDLFGRPVRRPALNTACLVLPDEQVRALHDDLGAALSAARQLLGSGGADLADRLADALSDIFGQLPLFRADSASYLARAAMQPDQAEEIASIWDEWDFSRHVPAPFPDELRPALGAARARLRERLSELRAVFPPTGALALTGHAHIDLAWLWPLAETRRKVLRTFSTVLTLMEQYPDFTFNQSSAQLYRFVQEDAPELFARIRERVAEGRWDVVGGMWVEPDGNLISGESWARQLLYGQRYFQKHFGRAARVGWLPDTFGYAANLPQLLRLAGMPYFFTTKLTWNETNVFPHDLYCWEGLDGSAVLAHSFSNPRPAAGYNGDIAALDAGQTWANFRGKRRHHESLLSYGYGDGGGGPTAGMLERYERLRDFPGLPRLRMARVDDFYDGVRARDLPVWVGEQYLELHRGTYTAQARIKFLNRRLEHALTEAEAAATLAYRLLNVPYPREEFAALWEILLRNQFHDILPGSGVKAVYDVARAELQGALGEAQARRARALEALTDAVEGPDRIVVWNLSSDDRPLNVALESGASLSVVTSDGQPVKTELQGGQLHLQGDVRVPGLGYLTLAVTGEGEGASQAAPQEDDLTLENEFLRVVVGEDGTLASLFDKAAGREVLAGRGNQLWAYVDVARAWDAWEIDASYAAEGQELTASERPRRLPGFLTQSVRVVRRHGQSTINQTYALRAGSSRLDIHTDIDWRGRHTFLRALTPVNVRGSHATFETAYGAVTRTTHANTSWDAAQFEVPAHRWADLSEGGGEGGYGVSLLNDGKYGHSCKGSVLGLSLLRSPVYPDPSADEGRHAFTYALYPHRGDWRGGTVREAHDLNAPLQAVRASSSGGRLPPRARLLDLPDNLRLSALKLAEDADAVIVRIYEAHGGRAPLNIENRLGLSGWATVNLLEEPQPDVSAVTPYQVVTLRGSVTGAE